MANTKCPYPQHILDECAGISVPNDLYYAWHAGYEAHKLEVLELTNSLNVLAEKMQEANHGNRSSLNH